MVIATILDIPKQLILKPWTNISTFKLKESVYFFLTLSIDNFEEPYEGWPSRTVLKWEEISWEVSLP